MRPTTMHTGLHARGLRAFLLALLALLLAELASAQEVYRCTGPAGGVIFQQMPCAGGQPVEVRPINVIQSQMPSADVMRDMQVRRAIERGELVQGMTEREVRRALGSPTAVHRAAGSWGSSAQLVYRYGDGTRRSVHLRDGGVDTVTTYQSDRPRRHR